MAHCQWQPEAQPPTGKVPLAVQCMPVTQPDSEVQRRGRDPAAGGEVTCDLRLRPPVNSLAAATALPVPLAVPWYYRAIDAGVLLLLVVRVGTYWHLAPTGTQALRTGSHWQASSY